LGSKVVKAAEYFDFAQTQDKVTKLHSSETFTLEGTLQRTCFDDFKEAIENEHSKEKPFSVVVFGPRGVGKTTMVAAALKVRNIIVFFSLALTIFGFKVAAPSFTTMHNFLLIAFHFCCPPFALY
jgi:hypothetical protein